MRKTIVTDYIHTQKLNLFSNVPQVHFLEVGVCVFFLVIRSSRKWSPSSLSSLILLHFLLFVGTNWEQSISPNNLPELWLIQKFVTI